MEQRLLAPLRTGPIQGLLDAQPGLAAAVKAAAQTAAANTKQQQLQHQHQLSSRKQQQ